MSFKKKVKGASCPKKLMRVMQVMRSFILGCLVRKPQSPKQISKSAPQKRKRATVMYNTVGQRTQKRDGTQHAFLKNLVVWAALCSARNRRKILTETSCALIVSGATIHHSMLCQLRLHSSTAILLMF